MEDMAEFKKLTETLACGGVKGQVFLAIQMEFVGRLHMETWLNTSAEERKLLMNQYR